MKTEPTDKPSVRAMPAAISAITATSCLGAGMDALRQGLQQGRTGLTRHDFLDCAFNTCLGEVAGLDAHALPAALQAHDCRNNRLADLALGQDGFTDAVAAARNTYGAHRVGVFLGSSTSGLLQTELAYRRRDAQGRLPADLDYQHTQNMFSLAGYVAARLELTGPQSVTSVACASGAKVFATAARALAAGLIDAAVVGGVDTLCLTTLYGFSSLELLSDDICRPFDAGRNGITIGEAGAFALLERVDAPRLQDQACPLLAGFGESSDAHHMSTPHPEGLGARAAMQQALQRAGCTPADIDYINLHGTATPSNDASEDAAVANLFGPATPVSSTKGAHGHTLGAAGALEAAICLIALADGLMPGGLNVRQLDPQLKSHFLTAPTPRELTTVMSNSFGFGGANAALVFCKAGRA